MKKKVIKKVIKKRIIAGLLVVGVCLTNASLFAENSNNLETILISDFIDYEEIGEQPYLIKEVTEKTTEEELLLPAKILVMVNGLQQEIAVTWKSDVDYETTQQDTYVYMVELPTQYSMDANLQNLMDNGQAKLPYIKVLVAPVVDESEDNQETITPPSGDVAEPETTEPEVKEPEIMEPVVDLPDNNVTKEEVAITTSQPRVSTETSVSNDLVKMYITDYGNFDIQGKIDGEFRKTTYNNKGYYTKLQVGENRIETVDIDTVDEFYTSTNDNTITVERILSVDQKLAGLTYKITNNGTTAKTVKIGNHTDIQVGSDDSATIFKTNVGLRMTSRRESDNGLQFNLVAKANDTPVDTMWMGRYTEAENNVFNSSNVDKVENTDSGIAFSWNKEVPAGQTITLKADFFAGKAPIATSSGSTLESENGKITVSQNYTDTAGSINTLYATVDNGATQSLGTLETTSDAMQTITGTITIPANWEDRSTHEVSWWIENEAFSASEVTTKTVVYYKTENKVIIQADIPTITPNPTPTPIPTPTLQTVVKNNVINTSDNTNYQKYVVLLMVTAVVFIGVVKKPKAE